MSVSKVKVEHAEWDGFARREGQARAQLSRRLPQSEIEDFVLLWQLLPGRVGLASNMSATIDRLEQLSHRDVEIAVWAGEGTRGKKRRKNITPRAATQADALLAHLQDTAEPDGAADELGQRSAAAMAEWRREHPEHVQLDVPDEEPDVARVRLRGHRVPKFGPNGVRYARGYPHQTIHCHAAGAGSGCVKMVTTNYRDERGTASVELVTTPLTLERFVEGAPKTPGRPGWRIGRSPENMKIRMCWRALVRMVAQGDGDLVVALFAMYSRALPPPEPEFTAALGREHADLAALVVDTKTVLVHAERLTRQLRAASSRPFECRVSVTPRTAAHDLLDRRPHETQERADARVSAINSIRREAEALLVHASDTYLAAKRLA